MAADINDKLKKYKSRFSTTLSTGIGTGTSDTLTPATVTGLPTDTAITLFIDRVDSTGTKTPSKLEAIKGVISGGNLTSYVRAVEGTEQAHSGGAVVEMVWNAADWNDMVDWGLEEHNQDGTHDTTKVVTPTDTQVLTNKTLTTPTLTSPVINTGFSGTAKASASDVTTGTEDAKIVTPKAIADSYIGRALSTDTNSYGIYNTSMARQALINGNFDVWQRGTSVALADATQTFQADRWLDYTTKDGGTLPTLTRSRQVQTAGALQGSFYFSRLATNGAGTSLGVNSYHQYAQRIEYGTRMLCGNGKKVTLSFYAKSDIANKKIGVSLQQNYGTGGSPSAAETLAGTSWTLTSSWVKYTYTFTTNTLTGKTFGTANDDMLIVNLWNMWGDTVGDPFGLTGAETYVGAGNIDIAQVQLCAGDVALPFQPKSFEEEMRACRRYCRQYGIGGGLDILSTCNQATTTAFAPIVFDTPMRSDNWTIETSTITGTNFQIISNNNAYNISAITVSAGKERNGGTLAVTMATATAGSAGFMRLATGQYIRLIDEL